MKLSLMKQSVLLFVVIFFVAFTFDDSKKNKILIELVSQSLQKAHFLDMEMNDDFSAKAFDLYIKRLDINKNFLLKEDIDALSKYRLEFDDEIKAGRYTFFDLSYELINKRIEEASKYYEPILANPFDFKSDENIELDADKMAYATSVEELKDRWRKNLKYQTLTRLVNQLEVQEKAIVNKDTNIKILSYEELEKSSRDKVLKSQADWFHRLAKIEHNDRIEVYINAITNVYDPHTSFFPPADKKQFDIDMSGRLEGIGATLQEQDGFIKVAQIVPGSASWRQGELKEGDLILKVAQADGEPVDIVDMRLDHAVQLIRGKKDTEVRLTVKKIDGSIKVIPIIRDIVIIDETLAKSAVLHDEKTNTNIGYIYLPKFYVDLEGNETANCAKDVEAEIVKLKAEKVSGIIFDLRNNTGGSLPYVVDIAGLFIKQGPIVQAKGRIGNPYIFMDKDTAMKYDGPLVVMVNSFSASASEIFAAAMQDYKRAVIIGGASTFGKGTVQRFFDFDTYVPKMQDDVKPLGSIKITTQKFYRINGGATQLKGVIPDIVLPDIYGFLEVGEKQEQYALAWDEIAKVPYNEWNKQSDLEKIVKKSKSRVGKDKTFLMIDQNAQRLKKQRDISFYSLNIEKYRAVKQQQETEDSKYKDLDKNPTALIVSPLRNQEDQIKSDAVKLEKLKRWHEEMKKDIYLFEAMSVMKDMI